MAMTCTFDGCSRPLKYPRIGLCGAHYKRLRRSGDPAGQRAHHGSLRAFADATASESETEECVLWPFASRMSGGYGLMWIDGEKMGAHVYVCRAKHGPKPGAGYEAAHSCGVRACINPLHLRWATRKENHADMLLHGTRSRGEQHAQSKLTEADVRAIRRAWQLGHASQADLSRRYGVHLRYVNCIIRRRVWAWLPDDRNALPKTTEQSQ